MDFARLEVGLCIKGIRATLSQTEISLTIEDHLVRFEETINSQFRLEDGKFATAIGVRPKPLETYAIGLAVKGIRDSYVSAAGGSDRGDPRAYFALLVLYYLNYLRPLYQDRLTIRQRLFALFSAANILERHFVH